MAKALTPPKIIGLLVSYMTLVVEEINFVFSLFAVHAGESHSVRRTSSIHAGSSIEIIESELSRLPRANWTQPQPKKDRLSWGPGQPGGYYTLFWGLPTLNSTSWGRSQAMTRSKN